MSKIMIHGALLALVICIQLNCGPTTNVITYFFPHTLHPNQIQFLNRHPCELATTAVYFGLSYGAYQVTYAITKEVLRNYLDGYNPYTRCCIEHFAAVGASGFCYHASCFVGKKLVASLMYDPQEDDAKKDG